MAKELNTLEVDAAAKRAIPDAGLRPSHLLWNIYMSEDEVRDDIEQAVTNLQRELMAMRQILTLLLAHHRGARI